MPGYVNHQDSGGLNHLESPLKKGFGSNLTLYAIQVMCVYWAQGQTDWTNIRPDKSLMDKSETRQISDQTNLRLDKS